MTKTACLILGSCLALQVPAHLMQSAGAESTDQASETAQKEETPLFVQSHFEELMEGESSQTVNNPTEVARYIHKTTRELLPVPFRGRSRQIAQTLIETANKHQMDPLFLMAVIKQESRFNPKALGAHGEIGLMQLKPSTALVFAALDGLEGDAAYAQVSQELADPVKNIQMGAAYLATLRASFKHRSPLYIAAYNMGAKRVRNHIASGVKPRIYSSRVLAQYVELSGDMNQMSLGSEGGRTQARQMVRTLDL